MGLPVAQTAHRASFSAKGGDELTWMGCGGSVGGGQWSSWRFSTCLVLIWDRGTDLLVPGVHGFG